MFYIVRHGQTNWNVEKKTMGHANIPLNDFGRNQAKNLANKIISLDVKKIVASDLLRASETAEIINKKLGLDISLDKRIREINYGDLEGISRDTLTQEAWDVFNNTPELLHAEPFEDVYFRIKDFFNEIINIGDNILIVTHGGALRMMMYYATNRNSFNKEKYAEISQFAKIGNATIYSWDGKMSELEPVIFSD